MELFPQNVYFDHPADKTNFSGYQPKTEQTTVQSFKLIQTNDTVHSFNVKPTKMLSDPVAEAFGLIHRHPSGENFCLGKQSLSEFKSCEHTHFNHLVCSATLLHFITMEYITSNKGGKDWPLKITFI